MFLSSSSDNEKSFSIKKNFLNWKNKMMFLRRWRGSSISNYRWGSRSTVSPSFTYITSIFIISYIFIITFTIVFIITFITFTITLFISLFIIITPSLISIITSSKIFNIIIFTTFITFNTRYTIMPHFNTYINHIFNITLTIIYFFTLNFIITFIFLPLSPL